MEGVNPVVVEYTAVPFGLVFVAILENSNNNPFSDKYSQESFAIQREATKLICIIF